ncbi:hypothetical protein L1047_11280 [Synechococcus sp. Nb3U1]|uniref:hypothetical protein n=1 Tax=Synechococcus sp. Nb3U1 TaxID=1914529 RepID=UPI001F3712DD|nr:hypothetical protein [Synechococcus sp. Nb3U1]MCF2971777.1 hypothetical protein [Synechococcus sp. Nb3U1]
MPIESRTRKSRESTSSRPRDRRRESARSSKAAALTTSLSLPKLIQENAVLQSRSQLLLMYSDFQTEMPNDGKTGIGTWLQSRLKEHGMPSLMRFGPRSRPQVFRRDEFSEWIKLALTPVSPKSDAIH